MSAIRVYEFAKKFDLSSKELLEVAKTNGINFNSHMSSMDEQQQKQLTNAITKPKTPAKAETNNQANHNRKNAQQNVKSNSEAKGTSMTEKTNNKQQHTAKRIYDRLVSEKGFTGGESTIRNKVRELKETIPKAFIPLQFEAGEALQVDWGEIVIYLNNKKMARINYIFILAI